MSSKKGSQKKKSMPKPSVLRPKKAKKGTLIIIGGNEDKSGEARILECIAKQVGKSKLVISTIASSEPQEYYDAYQASFGRLGLTNLIQHYITERSEAAEVSLTVLKKASGVFFTGGDQVRISSLVGDTAFEVGLRDIYAKGGVIAGTSAGAAAMGETMLIGGGASVSCKMADLHMAPGLGLLPNAIIDQHFSERGRIGRLLGAIALNPRILGIGIDEDTAIIVSDNSFDVVGSGAVYVVDGTQVTHTNIAETSPEKVLSLFGLTIHVLSEGDGYELVERKPLPARRINTCSGNATI